MSNNEKYPVNQLEIDLGSSVWQTWATPLYQGQNRCAWRDVQQMLALMLTKLLASEDSVAVYQAQHQKLLCATYEPFFAAILYWFGIVDKSEIKDVPDKIIRDMQLRIQAYLVLDPKWEEVITYALRGTDDANLVIWSAMIKK